MVLFLANADRENVETDFEKRLEHGHKKIKIVKDTGPMMMFSYLLMTLLAFSGLFLIGLILLQRGRGGGLAGAFGGMGGQSAFGTKAGDVFTRITIGVATAWILLCAGSVVALHNSSTGLRTDDSLFTKEPTGDRVDKAKPIDDDFANEAAPNAPKPSETKPSPDAPATNGDPHKPADQKPTDNVKPGAEGEVKPEEAKPQEPEKPTEPAAAATPVNPAPQTSEVPEKKAEEPANPTKPAEPKANEPPTANPK